VVLLQLRRPHNGPQGTCWCFTFIQGPGACWISRQHCCQLRCIRFCAPGSPLGLVQLLLQLVDLQGVGLLRELQLRVQQGPLLCGTGCCLLLLLL
jgi:hypothetical protein